MTDEHPTTPGAGDHLDDEVLVALADGECTAAEAAAAEAHLPGCERCAARRDLLAGAAGLAAQPVAPLPPQVRDEQIRRAVAAVAAAAPESPAPASRVVTDEPVARPLPRRPWWERGPARAAAVLAILAAIGGGFYGIARAMHTGGSVAGSAGTTSVPPEAALGSPVVELRRVAGPPPRSCSASSNPAPGSTVALPDVIETPGHAHSSCVLLGPLLVRILPPVPASIHGQGGLRGPDTLSIELPAADMPAGSEGSPPAGAEMVLVADDAAVGAVRSVTRSGEDVVVVVDGLPAGVAEYVANELTEGGGG